MNHHLRFSIWFPIVLVAAFAAGYLFWQQTLVPGPYDVEPMIVVENRAAGVDISNWQTYRNEQYGFELKYPDDYRELENVEDLIRSGEAPGWECAALLCLVAFPRWPGDYLDFGIKVFKADDYRFETEIDEIKYDRREGIWLKRQKTDKNGEWEKYFPKYKTGEGWIGYRLSENFTHRTIDGAMETWTYVRIAVPYKENLLIELGFAYGSLTNTKALSPIVSTLRFFGAADI